MLREDILRGVEDGKDIGVCHRDATSAAAIGDRSGQAAGEQGAAQEGEGEKEPFHGRSMPRPDEFDNLLMSGVKVAMGLDYCGRCGV